MILTNEEFQEELGPCLSFNFPDETFMIYLNYYLACKKADEAQHIYNSMRYFLWNAVKPDALYHDAKLTDPISILWHRHINWQTAALWLNHCGDYMLQMNWLGLKLYSDDKITANNYQAILKKCKHEKVLNELQAKGSTIIFPIISLYLENLEVRKVREWVNTLKHKSLIECTDIEDMFKNRCIGVTINYPNGDSICEGDVMPQLISIEEASRALISVAKTFRNTFNQLISFYNVDNFFNRNEDGAIIMDQIKSPLC